MFIIPSHKKSFLVVIAIIMSAISYSSADIDVLIGIYGSLNKNGMTSKVDITSQLRSKISNNSLTIGAGQYDILASDPAPGTSKTALVIYRDNTTIRLVYTHRSQALQIPNSAHPSICNVADLTGNANALSRFGIIKAYYGDLESNGQSVNMASLRIFDVTNKISTDNNGNILYPANKNAVYGDPANGTVKNLLIIYAVYGTLCIKFISEDTAQGTIKPDYATSADALYYLTKAQFVNALYNLTKVQFIMQILPLLTLKQIYF